MIKKIIFALILTTMLIATVNAADITNLNIPNNFQDIGDGVYVLYDNDNNAEEILSVVKYNEHDWNDYTTNDTSNQYFVIKDENNTYNYTDGSVNEVGSFELIDFEGDKYIIDFAQVGADNSYNQTYANLMELNKLNNITPIEE